LDTRTAEARRGRAHLVLGYRHLANCATYKTHWSSSRR